MPLTSFVHLCESMENITALCKTLMVKRVHRVSNIDTLEEGAEICVDCLERAGV